MISIIIPTYNESENILNLIADLKKVLDGSEISDYEILIMDDDSPDKTYQAVNDLRDSRARAINRKGKVRGLSAAVVDGFGEARGDIFVVMDADLSHPPQTVPLLAAAVKKDFCLAVGSRYVKGGGIENWPFLRRLTSKVACLMACPFTPIRDATSGFFAIRKTCLENAELNPMGFKIGLEVIFKSHHQNKIIEVPYVFTDRARGQSKLGSKVIFIYILQLLKAVFHKKNNT